MRVGEKPARGGWSRLRWFGLFVLCWVVVYLVDKPGWLL